MGHCRPRIHHQAAEDLAMTGIEDRWGVNGDMRYIRNELGLDARQPAERIGALQ